MGILNSIKEKLFGKSAPEPEKPAETAKTASAKTTPAASAGLGGYVPGGSNFTPGVIKPLQPAAAKPEPVDIEAVLDAAVQAKGQKLNWRQSIVDLMKALDLDSSLSARKELAADLKYSGTAADGSAEKNIWLHKELMKTLAENGGKIPGDLLK